MLAFWQKIKQKKKFLSLAFLVTSAFFFLSFLLLDFSFPFRPAPSYSQLILARDSTVMHAYLSADDKWRLKTELHEISPLLREVIVEKEDRFFYWHFGVNPLAVLRAAANNLIQGRRTSGASTITMQVVRLLEPRPRTLQSKLIESFRALQLEWHYSKDEILQFYLNLVPYGGNLEGVKSASLLYFNQPPEQLSLAQAITLAIIPNRPTSLTLGEDDAAILEARNHWLSIFAKKGIFSPEKIQRAKDEPLEPAFLPESRYKPGQSYITARFQRLAPHFSRFLHLKAPEKASLQSTIDAEIQSRAESFLHDYAQRTRRSGIFHNAALIIDNEKNEILAWVGSPNFYNKKTEGEVDGTQAYRSPGSTLKPLLYGLAMDKGYLTPKRKILDIPTDIDGYTPENFDGKFNGEVSTEIALSYSLNVPAVNTLQQMGVHVLTDALKKAQFLEVEKNAEQLGLSLALGGCGVRLFELAGLYAALANAGRYRPLQFLAHSKDTTSRKLLSPEATWMVSDILTQVERPELPSDYQYSEGVPKIAWKTGTSYGRRDAWSVGYNKRYTVAVWCGNFNAKGVENLTGAQIATPLLFKLFLMLDANTKEDGAWAAQPEGLAERPVCPESGLPPGPNCSPLITDYFIPKVSSVETCTHLRYVFTSADEEISYCSHCLPSQNYKKKLYPNYSPEVLAYKEAFGIKYTKIPPHNPRCMHLTGKYSADGALKILSPTAGNTYILPQGKAQILLRAQPPAGAEEVHWYLNDVFLKTTSPHEDFFISPPCGKVKISCSDDKGHSVHATITVEGACGEATKENATP